MRRLVTEIVFISPVKDRTLLLGCHQHLRDVPLENLFNS